MRKYLLIVAVLISFKSIFSQDDNGKRIRQEFDSLKNVLPKLSGAEMVDCLNALTRKAFDLPLGSWKAEADTARPYALLANKEAKRIGYKKGLGHSYVNLETIDCMMFGTYAQVQKRFDTATFNSANQNAKNAIIIGEELNDHNLLGETYYVLNWLFSETVKPNIKSLNQGQYKQYQEDLIDYSKKAVVNFEKTENKQRFARSLENLYYALNANNRFEEGFEAMKKAISLYHESRDGREILASTNLTEFLLINGEFENAFDYCKKIIDAAEQSRKTSNDYKDFFYGQGFAHMADLNILAGDYETALQYIRKGYDFYPTDSFPMAVWASNIGEVYRLMENYDSALYYLKPFETMQARYALAGRIMKGKLKLTSLYISMKQYDKALAIIVEMKKKINEGKEINSDGVMVGLKGRFCLNAAKAWIGKRDFQKALNYACEGLTLLKSVNWKMNVIDNYLILSETYKNLNRSDSAYYYLKEYMSMKDSVLNRQFYFRLNSYKKQAEEERTTSQINLLNKDNQLKEQKLKQQATVKNGLIIGITLLLLLGVFIFRNLSLKRKNDKLQLKKDLEMHQMKNDKKHAELKQQAAELEMQALRDQMNPHFIFNCLSSINRFILRNEPEAASDYLTRFSRLIRMVLINSQKPVITLEDELETLRLYLDMERMRFKNSFNHNIIFSNTVDAGNISIPSMLLQPFCENAIWHGLMHLPSVREGKECHGRLDITLSMSDRTPLEENKILHCTIADNGVGREKAAELNSKSTEKGKSLGLKITTERLALLNAGKGFSTSYDIEDLKDEQGNAAGTKVVLKISYRETVEEIA